MLRRVVRDRSARAVSERVELEALENRVLLAAVWDGGPGGTGTDFFEPTNWVGDVLPVAGDDVTIDIAGDPLIQYDGASLAFNSFNSTEDIEVIGGVLGLAPAGTADIDGLLRIDDAVIEGGTWDVTGGSLRSTADSTNAIRDAAIVGEISILASSGRVRLEGTTTFTTVRLGTNSASVAFAPGTTLSGDIILSGGSGPRYIEMFSTGTLTIPAGRSVTSDPGFGGEARFDFSGWFNQPMTLVNDGTIDLETTSSNHYIRPRGGLTNTGSIETRGGRVNFPGVIDNDGTIHGNGAELDFEDVWDNSGGQIIITDSLLVLDGTFTAAQLGTITQNGSATVRVEGDLDNTGNSLDFDATTGSWTLDGGTITGGTLTSADGERLNFAADSGNRLIDVAVTYEIHIGGSGRVGIAGTTTYPSIRLAANSASVGFAPGSTLGGDIILSGGSGPRYIEMISPGMLTIPVGRNVMSDPGFAGSLRFDFSGWFNQAMTLVNDGTIDVESTDLNHYIRPRGGLTTNGTIETRGGTLNFPDPITNNGTIHGNGAGLNFEGAWDNTSGQIIITDAPLILDGTFTTAGLGTITQNGSASVALEGDLDNSGDSLDFNAATGSWTLDGGTVTGGTLTSADGQMLRMGPSTANRLIDVTVTHEINIGGSGRVGLVGTTTYPSIRLAANSAAVGFEPGSTLVGDIFLSGGGGPRYIEMISPGMLTIPVGRSVMSDAGFGGNLRFDFAGWFNQSMTLVNDGTIDVESNENDHYIRPRSGLTNTGTIEFRGSMVNFPNGFDNDGVIHGNGAGIDIEGVWDNSGGQIIITDETLILDGSFTTAQIGTITQNGSAMVILAGDLDNTGDSLDFNSTTGSWTLDDGAVTGGTLTSSDGESLLIGQDTANRLIDVTITYELTVGGSQRVGLAGTTTYPSIRLMGGSASVGFAAGSTLMGDIILSGGSGLRYIEMFEDGMLTIPAGVSVRSEGGFGGELRMDFSGWFNRSMTLVNDGTIEVESTGGTSNHYVRPRSGLTNNGTIETRGGTMNFPVGFDNDGVIHGNGAGLQLDGAWDNSGGQIIITDVLLELDGSFTTSQLGVITRAGTGEIRLTGVIDNSGDSLDFNAGTGSWIMLGGTVMGGTLTFADGAMLEMGSNGSNRLVDVTLADELVISLTSGRVRIEGTTSYPSVRLLGSSSGISIPANTSLQGDVVLDGASGARYVDLDGTNGTMTIPAGRSVTGAPGFGGYLRLGSGGWYAGDVDLIVEGEINVESSGTRSVEIFTQTLDNQGLVAGSGGDSLIRTASMTLTNTGTLRAAGGGEFSIDLQGNDFTNDGTLEAAPGSTVLVEDNLIQTAAATISVEIQGVNAADIGQIVVVGSATLAGTMLVTEVNGWSADCVNLNFFNAGSIIGDFDTLDLPNFPAGHQALIVFVPGNQVLRFAISPESDWNRDGILDTSDFINFLNDWVANEPQADFNGDNLINTADFIAFLNNFVNGC